MASTGYHRRLIACAMLIAAALLAQVNAIHIYLEWNVTLDSTIKPVSQDQPVRTFGFVVSQFMEV